MKILKSISRGIRNWIAWAPLLWKDRDWDYDFLERIVAFKMSRMADCIESNNIIEGNKRVARQLRYAVYLLDRIDSNIDAERAAEIFHDKWGEPEYSFVPVEEPVKGSRMVTTYPYVTNEEQEKQNHLDFLEMVITSDDKRNELYRRFFKHWATYHRNWWD